MKIPEIRAKYYLVVDFEMCMVKGNAKKKMWGGRQEIIQIGAVMLDHKNRIMDEFSSYVKPEYGKIDDFIENLTGIKQENVEDAPDLRSVLMSFADWIGERKVVVMSWSDSDYQQLQMEMRVKKIKHHKIQNLLDEWVDFQRSFDRMLGLKNQYALEEAMRISRVESMGRAHDGLCDAYNTARLFVKVQRQSTFKFELVPVSEYAEKVEHLSFTMGDLFTPELLAQLKPVEEVEEISSEKSETKSWSIWRKLYSFFKGKEEASDECWNKILFAIEMRKLELFDLVGEIGFKKKIAEATV